MLTISNVLLAQVHAHLEAGYPNEACGILLGDVDADAKVVKDLALVANAWEAESECEGLRNRYLITPEDVARADRQAARQGMDIIGFFHSHPDCPARPSGTDREFAWPTIAFMIISVVQGKAITTNSWILRDDRSQFDEETITINA